MMVGIGMFLAFKKPRKGQQMMRVMDSAKELKVLENRTTLDLSLNDLRIVLGCFNAVAYMAGIDDETYLDSEALDLRSRLESRYKRLLGRSRD
jgi:hypothetical protein